MPHATRLLSGVTTAEETLGLSALGPLDREVPVAVLEIFIALGLLVAVVGLLRKSRLSAVYMSAVADLFVLDSVLRLIAGLATAPAIVTLMLGLAGAGAMLTPASRRWCTEPIWP